MAVSQPATSHQPPATNVAALADAMLVIVSEKTGYPVEMLEMSMDMESDLGIDSIKRVEILGAMQEQHPELPEVNPAELAELRTLQQIVDHLSVDSEQLTVNSVQFSVAPEPAAQSPISNPSTSSGQVLQSPASNVAELAQAMLVIVSEKTGYPVEMLEMSMDMESDLGIDSIKRVEILGAMQEQHPELPEVNPAELAELRTLQQIVDHLSVDSEQLTVNSVQFSVAPEPAAQSPISNPSTSSGQVLQSPASNVAELAQAMLVIVSEKTGYPVEMLEMSMDMESDLGIDSIKRVEILGAMQEQHPELPEVNPAELAELRTLQQIVDHLSVDSEQLTVNSGQSTDKGQRLTTNGRHTSPSPILRQAQDEFFIPETDSGQVVESPTTNVAELEQAMLVIVSEKTGYPVEMLEMSMDMESDLGIDSIKRVEILGAMQEQHPELPEVNPAELAELRTLQQIVDHLQNDHLNGSLTGEPEKKLVRL